MDGSRKHFDVRSLFCGLHAAWQICTPDLGCNDDDDGSIPGIRQNREWNVSKTGTVLLCSGSGFCGCCFSLPRSRKTRDDEMYSHIGIINSASTGFKFQCVYDFILKEDKTPTSIGGEL